MAEEVYSRHGNVIIGPSMAHFGSTSYPIANIGSVSIKDIGRGPAGPLGVIMAIVGLILLLQSNVFVGLVLLALGAILFIRAKPKAALVLKTSSGDVQAMESTEKQIIADTKTAIERAFMNRR
ncbi:DUF6232 family protein [Mesorhizobium sp. M0296]|uniref:DUF6232 family protein n=1 Tax=Mesorhizobium sp. M0296 TaxID=2956931 RepID=UPI00333E0063